MLPSQLSQDCFSPSERPTSSLSNQSYLNFLRFVALDCRAKARADIFEACALLSLEKSTSQVAHADALMRCLDQALGKRAVLYRPGTEETSFDEDWLLELGRAIARGDEQSTTFLIFSRVRPQSRRHVRFFMGGITECFSPD